MNDDFLLELRREPPPQFARELKRRLDRQAWRRRRAAILRALFGVVLIGGVATAALLLRERPEQAAGNAAPVRQSVVRSPFAGTGKPVAPSSVDSRMTADSAVASQLEAVASEAGDIPVAFTTAPLPRSLAQGLVGRLSKYGFFAQPRMAYMEDDEALRTLCGGNTDFVMVSRRISRDEHALCDKWGIAIKEWKIGYQAVVLAAGPKTRPLSLTPRDVFLAIAGRIPDPAGNQRLIDNPNVTWHDVDARFDDREIDIVDSTQGAVFLQLMMEAGCESFPWIRSLRSSDRPRYDSICRAMRSDGRFRASDLRFMRYRLGMEPSFFALDYSNYYAPPRGSESDLREELPVTLLAGPAPAPATLADGTYSAARPVYVYAQRSHLDWNRAAQKLADDLTDPDAVGPDGYLVRLGLVPLDTHDSRSTQAKEQSR